MPFGTCTVFEHTICDGYRGDVWLYLEEGAQLVGLIQTYGRDSDVTYRIVFSAPRAYAYLYGLMKLDGQKKSRQSYIVSHKSPNCLSDIRFKSVLYDQSCGTFESHVTVEEGACQTVALQEARTLLLSPRARQLSKPELRIYTNDVVCKHGATVGSLDVEGLYYLTSRGLGSVLARSLMVEAFLSDFVHSVAQRSSILAQNLCL